MKILIGFAIGALLGIFYSHLGDSFIHLIPHSFAAHEHEEETEEVIEENEIVEEETHEEEEDISKEFLTSLLLILGVLCFFLIEKGMMIL